MFVDFDRIAIGESRSLVREITEGDVRRFVELTGDDNPLHVDRRFAETTSFKDIVVHGMLGASFLSTVIGTQLPGPGALWVSQNLQFLLPVRLGDVLTVTCTVLRKHERDRLLELETVIVNQARQTVLSGTGKVKLLENTVAPSASNENDEPPVAIITGGGGGIGSAISRRLVADGARVVITYASRGDRADALAHELSADGVRAITVKANLAVEADVERMWRDAQRAFGSPTIVINNASPRIGASSLAAGDWSDFQRQLDVQVKGAFLLIQRCAPAMAERRWGRIVNITTQAIQGPPSIGWTSYAVAKAALSMMSRYLAAELGPQGVTVNCIAPGMTETALIGDVPQKTQLMVARQTPRRRLARPEDIAAAVAYLVSREADFVTGHTLSVNGGIVMT